MYFETQLSDNISLVTNCSNKLFAGYYINYIQIFKAGTISVVKSIACDVPCLLQIVPILVYVVYCMVGVNITLLMGVLTAATNLHQFWV